MEYVGFVEKRKVKRTSRLLEMEKEIEDIFVSSVILKDMEDRQGRIGNYEG